MKKIPFLALLILLLVSACAPAQQEEAEVVVYRSPTWGCCSDWVGYMEENGFTVQVEDVQDLAAVKRQYNVPSELQSCHTAIVDGYIIEGHVPVAEINRLLAERPEVNGLAVAGMPIGSPGMEVEGAAAQSYDVVAFADGGRMEVYASYGP